MVSERQQAYLEAMEIGVWQLRDAPAAEPVAAPAKASDTPAPVNKPAHDASPAPTTIAQPRLQLGAGSGGVLLICSTGEQSASRLANDIDRALGGVPVWGWPESSEDAVGLAEAIEEKLFTTVAIFGEGLASSLFDGGLPANSGPAKIVVLPSMASLQAQSSSRRSLWQTLCKNSLVGH